MTALVGAEALLDEGPAARNWTMRDAHLVRPGWVVLVAGRPIEVTHVSRIADATRVSIRFHGGAAMCVRVDAQLWTRDLQQAAALADEVTLASIVLLTDVLLGETSGDTEDQG